MSPKQERVFHDALALPAMARAELIQQLLHSFDLNPTETAEFEAARASEAHDRFLAYQHGEITACPVDEAFDAIMKRFEN